MKKFMVVLLALALTFSMLTGCADENVTGTDGGTSGGGTEVASEGFAKVGLGHVVSAAKSSDATDEAGVKVEVGTALAAVALNADGTFAKVVIDFAQTKVNFDTEGKFASAAASMVADGKATEDRLAKLASKNELKELYGMGNENNAGEWYLQAAAFADWMEGKTLAEVMGMKLNEEGRPAEADLTSSITVRVGDYLAAVEEAYNNAIEVGAEGGVKLGIGVETNVKGTKDATDDNGPIAQVDTGITVAAFDANGKVVSAINDHVQSKLFFDKEGKFAKAESIVNEENKATEDINAKLASKNELKEIYGMKGQAKETNKEWYEQAAHLADYYVGKTVSEITSMKTREKDASHLVVPDVPELVGMVSIDVADSFTIIQKAYDNAK